MKNTLLLLVLFLFSSCVKNSETKTIAEYREMAVQSALNDVKHFAKEDNLLKHYEHATVEWVDLQGNVVKSYTHSERKLGLFSYFPVLSFILPRNYENYEVIVTLKNGALLDVKAFHNIVTLESESDCNEAIFSCITNIK